MNNWQVPRPPDNTGHARNYNPDTGKTDWMFVGILVFAALVIVISVGRGIWVVVQQGKAATLTLAISLQAALALHFLFDVPYVLKGYAMFVGGALFVTGLVSSIVWGVKYFDRRYKQENENQNHGEEPPSWSI